MDDEHVILLLYVDELFLRGNEKKISECKKKLATEFEMKDLGLMHYFLGLEVWKILSSRWILILILTHDLGTKNQYHERIINKYS